MLLSFATVRGFREQITEKLNLIHGDFIIDATDNTETGEPRSFPITDIHAFSSLKKIEIVENVLPSFSKACILKSDDEIEGLIAKGVDRNKILAYLKGFNCESTNELSEFPIAISKSLAKKLNLNLNDDVKAVFFVQDSSGNNRPKARRFTIDALFETGIETVDNSMVVMDIQQMYRLYGTDSVISQLEIWTDKSINGIEKKNLRNQLYDCINLQKLRVNTSKEFSRTVFDWLAILNVNVVIILILMALVAIAAMCTTILILITEKTSFIGLIQSMGARSKDIRKVFVFQGLIIVILGLLLGNALAFGIGLGQNYFKWISLNQDIYFINHVVVSFNWMEVLLVNVGAIVLVYLSLFMPVNYIRKISPLKAIRFK